MNSRDDGDAVAGGGAEDAAAMEMAMAEDKGGSVNSRSMS